MDYGTSFFGRSFDSSTIGATSTPTLTLKNAYEQIRNEKLPPKADDEIQKRAFAALPADALPTDLGPTKSLIAAPAQMRALGLLPPNADPNEPTEQTAAMGL